MGDLLFDFIGEIVRVVAKVDWIRFSAFLAETVFVAYLCPTIMDSP